MDTTRENSFVECSKSIYEQLAEKFKENEIELGFVLKTGFISWLNQSEERIQKYIDGIDIQELVADYISETLKEDEVEEDIN